MECGLRTDRLLAHSKERSEVQVDLRALPLPRTDHASSPLQPE